MKHTEEQLRRNFAKNLAYYRKKAGLTQLELAEKMNYSDKSVSKWERADGIPDLFVAALLSELFGVTLNDMISDKVRKSRNTFRNRLLTTLLSVGVVWLVAVCSFFLFWLLLPQMRGWLFFIYAIAVSAVVLVVFASIWWNKLCRFLSVSLLIWSIPLCIVLSFPDEARINMIFVVAAAVQVLAVPWFLLKK